MRSPGARAATPMNPEVLPTVFGPSSTRSSPPRRRSAGTSWTEIRAVVVSGIAALLSDRRGRPPFDPFLDDGELHLAVAVDPLGHAGVVDRRGGLHGEVLHPGHPGAAGDLVVAP